MKKFIITALAAAAFTACSAFAVSAETPITISDVSISETETEGISTFSFDCSASVEADDFTFILTTAELTEDIAFDKIVHIDQVSNNSEGTYSFPVSDARIPEGTKKLYLRVGGTGITEPADFVLELQSVVPGDANGDGTANTDDIIVVRKYIAGLTNDIVHDAANIEVSSDEIDTNDLIMLRKLVAGLITIE